MCTCCGLLNIFWRFSRLRSLLRWWLDTRWLLVGRRGLLFSARRQLLRLHRTTSRPLIDVLMLLLFTRVRSLINWVRPLINRVRPLVNWVRLLSNMVR